MCVEKDERATDNKIKTGIQNILGSVVLLGLPMVASGIFGAWLTIGDHSSSIKQLERTDDTLQRHIDSLIRWRIDTEGNRFRAEDGQRLSAKIDSIDRRVQEHEVSARGWIEAIKRNTDIVLENQKKAHTHRWQTESDK